MAFMVIGDYEVFSNFSSNDESDDSDNDDNVEGSMINWMIV